MGKMKTFIKSAILLLLRLRQNMPRSEGVQGQLKHATSQNKL